MDIKEIISKIHVDAGIDPDLRMAKNADELKNGKNMLLLSRFAEKHSLKGELCAALCFCGRFNDASGSNTAFSVGAQILRDCYGKIDSFFAPADDTELFNATAAILKAYKKNVKVTAVYKKMLPDGIDLGLIDRVVGLDGDKAKEIQNEVFSTENIVIGPLAAAALGTACDEIKNADDAHSRTVVLFPDIS
ncbi:MAG: hypothetical protein IJS90_03930 [Clostridia bacterium]|nr:hypothetical protein [Clostridia bacterium]